MFVSKSFRFVSPGGRVTNQNNIQNITKKLVRKQVLNFQPYIPGKPIAQLQRELRLKNIIKLASNENPLGPSAEVIKSIKNNLNNIFLYPESDCPVLRDKLAKKLGVSTPCLIFGNGSDEIIELIGKTFLNPQDEIIVSEHAFIRYQMSGDLMGCKVITVPMKNFKHDLENMARQITRKTKIIFIANPNNPTGTYNTKSEVARFIRIVRKDILIVFDEAYHEYAMIKKDYPKTIQYLNKFPNIIILRTFSKIYALAGLRIGYAIANPAIVSYLDRIRPPFNVNSIAQIAALAAIDDRRQIKNSLDLMKEEKKYLCSELDKMCLTHIPSATNFILINVKCNGYNVFKALLKKGMIARAMSEYGFSQYIRVTVGLPQENRKFISALKQVLRKG